VRLMQSHDSGRGPTTPAWLVWQAFTAHHEAHALRAAGLLLGARFQGRDRPLRGRGRPPWDGREGAPPPPGRAWTPHSPLLRPPRCAGPCPACAALAVALSTQCMMLCSSAHGIRTVDGAAV